MVNSYSIYRFSYHIFSDDITLLTTHKRILYNINFQHRLLNGMHDFPCSTFKVIYYQGWGTCGMGGNIGLSPG